MGVNLYWCLGCLVFVGLLLDYCWTIVWSFRDALFFRRFQYSWDGFNLRIPSFIVWLVYVLIPNLRISAVPSVAFWSARAIATCICGAHISMFLNGAVVKKDGFFVTRLWSDGIRQYTFYLYSLCRRNSSSRRLFVKVSLFSRATISHLLFQILRCIWRRALTTPLLHADIFP